MSNFEHNIQEEQTENQLPIWRRAIYVAIGSVAVAMGGAMMVSGEVVSGTRAISIGGGVAVLGYIIDEKFHRSAQDLDNRGEV